jgi:hypothetical protein
MRINATSAWDDEVKEFQIFLDGAQICKINLPDFKTAHALGEAMNRIRQESFRKGELCMRDKIIEASKS